MGLYRGWEPRWATQAAREVGLGAFQRKHRRATVFERRHTVWIAAWFAWFLFVGLRDHSATFVLVVVGIAVVTLAGYAVLLAWETWEDPSGVRWPKRIAIYDGGFVVNGRGRTRAVRWEQVTLTGPAWVKDGAPATNCRIRYVLPDGTDEYSVCPSFTGKRALARTLENPQG